jgi:hypothetical protein
MPIISSFLDFLLYVPRTVSDDTTNTTMHGLFMSPVPTQSIVKDLRTWAIRTNLRHTAPSFVLGAGLVLLLVIESSGHDSNPLGSEQMFISASIASLCLLVFTIWGFLLGTGLASAGLPWKATSTGSVLLLWAIPCFILVAWAGSHISAWTWNVFVYGGVTPVYTPYTDSYDYNNRYSSEVWRFCWYVAHYACMLGTLALGAHFAAPRLMEHRRSGRWG